MMRTRVFQKEGVSWLEVRVEDQGPGIPRAHWHRIFDKYNIVELKKKGVAQIGLGLAFCKMAVEAHGGSIRVEDNRPRGAVFVVEMAYAPPSSLESGNKERL